MNNYTLEEANAFIAGMYYASKVIADSGRGVVQTRKINKEAMRLTMLKQQAVVRGGILTADQQQTMNIVDSLKPLPPEVLARYEAGMSGNA